MLLDVSQEVFKEKSQPLSWVMALFIFTLLCGSPVFAGQSPLKILESSEHMAAWLGASTKPPVYAANASQPLVPASTLKVLTATLALEKWGPEHHFETGFYLADVSGKRGDGHDEVGQALWVKGSGDPYLTSEELGVLAQRLAERLRAAGVRSLLRIGLDTSLFAKQLRIPGRGDSSNPYDAIPSAIAANFNTLALEYTAAGLQTGEQQTPLVPMSRKLAKALPRSASGRARISIHDADDAARYFGELLTYFLRQQGTDISGSPSLGRVPENAHLVYTHKNTLALRTVIHNMLEYSNNFIANQLFLLLGIGQGGECNQQTRLECSQRWASGRLEEWGLESMVVREGAGLSRENQASAHDMAKLLDRFYPWRHLLKKKGDWLLYKTGTLHGIRTLVGYLRADAESEWQPFVVFINEPRAHGFRFSVAEALREKVSRRR
ncbi:MAG: D-alanyl-D-alanine carboxypeptidase/D-alanyl-D-alanine-endopeptidase [bacterium]